jgi:hypothetical protein
MSGRKYSHRMMPWLLCLAAVGAAGCDVPRTHLTATRRADDGEPGVDSGSDGDGGPGGDSGSGGEGGSDGSVKVCLETRLDLTIPTGNVVLVVERSNAMNTLNDSTCASCGTYFTALEQAVEALTTATSNHFRWGLKLFPSPGDQTGCLVSPALDVSLAADAHASIAAALAAASPSGSAPLTAAVRGTSSYLNGLPGGEPSFLLLATAGAPTCAANDPAQDDLSAALAAVDAAPQFTFVLGLGPQRAHFDKLADVGWTDSGYTAEQALSLLHDMESLAKELASCVYPLPGGALGDRSVTVLLDGAALMPGATDGFSVSSDGASVRLRGSACYASHASVVIRVGCDS